MTQIKINRMYAHELDAAIQDLEERGWELVKRTASESEHKNYNYRGDSLGKKYKYAHTEVHKKHTAVMRRVEEVRLL